MTTHTAPGLQPMVAPATTALLVVDVQNDFVDDRGRVGREGTDLAALQDAIRQINRLIDAAREVGVAVIYVRTVHGPDVDTAPYQARYERRGMSPADTLCHAGTWGAELAADLRPPRPPETVIVKHGYDAFATSELPALLQQLGTRAVIVTGVVANLCVRATTFSAFEHGYFPIVPQESTASTDPQVARAALEDIVAWYGEVPTVDEVLAAWRGVSAAV
jgi:ureidoacrylate peracid hydrolase